MSGPLVSVVIPTYGRTNTLYRALDSVKNQNYDNIEVIVVNDNPPKSKNAEAVINLIESYGTIKNSLTLINNVTNLGGALARNVGLDASNGKYISFLDDDDEILPDKIEMQTQLLEDCPDVSLVYCYTKTIIDDEKDNTILYTRNDYSGNCMKDLLLDGTIAATTQWLCRKSDLIEIAGFDDVPSKQDSTLIMKLLEAGKKIDRVPQVLSIYHVQRKNSISTSNRSIEGLHIFHERCRKHYDILSKNEVRDVEYQFAEQLYLKTYKDKRESKVAFAEMKKNRFFKSYLKKIYYYLFFLKHKE